MSALYLETSLSFWFQPDHQETRREAAGEVETSHNICFATKVRFFRRKATEKDEHIGAV